MDYELHYIGSRLDLSKSGDAVVMRRWGVCERPGYQNEVDYFLLPAVQDDDLACRRIRCVCAMGCHEAASQDRGEIIRRGTVCGP